MDQIAGLTVPVLPDALSGVKIFPISAGTKDPIGGSNGWKDASNDPAQIAAWERAYPGCNWAVACGLSDLFVFDVDPNGIEAWRALVAADPAISAAMDAAYTVTTPKGGWHVYFQGQGPTTASRIAQGIDTRGGMMVDGKLVSGGYVLLPGSRTVAGPGRVDGAYTEQGGALLPFTDAIKAIVPERKKASVKGLDKNPDFDQPRNVQWAKDLLKTYVETGRVSKEGSGGNDTAFRVCASILDKAISPALCFDLLLEHWNDYCEPPWSDAELETLVRNAAEYGEDTEGGLKGFQSNDDAFAGIAAGLADWVPQDAPKKPERARGHVMPMHDYADSVGDPTWLIPGFVPAVGTGMMYGASGSYKSFLTFDMAYCLAFGIAGQWGAPPVQNDVLVIMGEGPAATARKRWPAWMEWQGITDRENHRLFVLDRVPPLDDTDGWEGVKADLAKLGVKPALIVLDTLSRLMVGFDENSSKDAALATGFMEGLSRYYEGFVLAIHHTGKDEKKGARGSSVFGANLDSALSVTKRQNGTELRVKKHKDADAGDDAHFFKVKEVAASIVLEKTESLAEAPTAGKSTHAWASKEEVAAFLGEHGPQSTAMLVQLIAEANGLDPQIVRKKIVNNQDLGWLKRDGNTWGLPVVAEAVREFDL